MEYGCPINDNECKNNIFKNDIYRNSSLGFGSKYSSPNPPNLYLPYKKKFNYLNNMEINSNIPSINDTTVPKKNAFPLNEECENWCYKSNNCNAVSYNYNNKGQIECKYYNDSPKVIFDNRIGKIGNNVALRPDASYEVFNKEYVNSKEYNVPTQMSESEEECCNIMEHFASKDCPFSEEEKINEEGSNCAAILDTCMEEENYKLCPKEKYSMCPNKKYGFCHEEESMCPNKMDILCPSIINNCINSKFGCCLDGVTTKNNENGTNCPNPPGKTCLNSKMGCCPGTITPKEYLFKCPGKNQKEKEDCKIFANQLFNCELNKNQKGDPDAFRGKVCRTSSDCNHFAIAVGLSFVPQSKCNKEGIEGLLNSETNRTLFTLANMNEIINSKILDEKVGNQK